MSNVIAADLFCGAGGSSTGLLEAVRELGMKVQLIAINHWDVAIATHSLNHPNVSHFNSDLKDIDPRKIVPGGRLRLLIASPECTHFSRARGGKPMNKQSRASVKYVLRWVTTLDVDDVLIENVPEFMDWGPLHRKGARAETPIKNRKGEYFHRFIAKMEEHGYQVKWRLLNAADYGDPTTRKRLFIIARKHMPVRFPEPSHTQNANDMFGMHSIWKPARDIIDWSLKGESIFHRKRPLVPNTLRRIMAGLQKFGGKAFIIGQQSGAMPRDVDQPVPTVAGAGAISLVQPFIVPFYTENKGQAPRIHSIEEPLPIITTEPRFGLAQPFIVSVGGPEGQGRKPHSIDKPLGTILPDDHRALIEPFIMAVNHGADDKRSYSLDDPMPTVTSVDAWALVEPFLVSLRGTDGSHIESSSKSIKEPIPTLTGGLHIGLVEPFLVEYYGTGTVSSIDEPLKTQTGKDRFGLVQPMPVKAEDGKTYMLDILFRMLRPHELAAAMSFPKDYQFSGNREQIVKQIGNAVPVNLAKALCKTLLE